MKREQQYDKLQAALSSGNRAEAERLAQGASSQAKVDLLALAIERRAPELLAFLLSTGADPYLPSTKGSSPLTMASFLGLPTFVTALLDGKPLAVEKSARRGITPLMMAAMYGHDEVVRILLKAGAKPEEICARPDSSLIRVKGSVLRILRDAGGQLPRGIVEMLDKGVALGDPDRGRT